MDYMAEIATLNKSTCNEFDKGIPLGKVTVLAGESGTGKSFIAAGNVVRHAQQQGTRGPMSSENALDEKWPHALDDTSPDKLLKLNMSMIDDVAKTISDFMKDYKAEYAQAELKTLQSTFVIDSLGMLLTPIDVDPFNKGDTKGDMGFKPRFNLSLAYMNMSVLQQLLAFNSHMLQDMFDQMINVVDKVLLMQVVLLLQCVNLNLKQMQSLKQNSSNGIHVKL